MKNNFVLRIFVFAFLLLASCNQYIEDQNGQMPLVAVKTTLLKSGNIEEYLTFNGKTIYLKKNTLVSPISGYVKKVNKKYGDIIQKNDVLFELQTKESSALENTGAIKAALGVIEVVASSDGYINEMMIADAGAFVMEGSPLCKIVENAEIIIRVNVPFQYHALMKPGAVCTLFLSDNTSIEGKVGRILPLVNEANQTLEVLIVPNTDRQLPENLNLIVEFVNRHHPDALLITKSAVMTNETQNHFWVMKVESGNLSLKVPVSIGIENDTLVEIFSEGLSLNDVIISEGAYSLPDSTLVTILK